MAPSGNLQIGSADGIALWICGHYYAFLLEGELLCSTGEMMQTARRPKSWGGEIL